MVIYLDEDEETVFPSIHDEVEDDDDNLDEDAAADRSTGDLFDPIQAAVKPRSGPFGDVAYEV